MLKYDLNYIQMLFLIKINNKPDTTQKELSQTFFFN